MPPSLGVNLRVTGHCNQGGRKYMEDVFGVAYQPTEDQKDLEFAFFGIFDGHGGPEASKFAKDHLMDAITKQKSFWSDDDEMVLKAIREGFLSTQQAMWKDLPNWRKTSSGLPSTAGTTASICFIKRGKLFIGHVGDSGIVLGERDPNNPTRWRARPLTRDHKPDCEIELERIRKAGGKVVAKSGVPRVVWYRPTGGHQGPVRRSTNIEEIPFLAVARALGDLWSYNSKDDVFVVSPDPDLHVYDLNLLKDRCLILGTDGLWNVMSPGMSVQTAFDTEKNNERQILEPDFGHVWVNPSKKLVDQSLQRWNMCNLRADNVSVVTVMLDPPGPPRAKVLRSLHGLESPKAKVQTAAVIRPKSPDASAVIVDRSEKKPLPNGFSIISRCPNSSDESEKEGTNLAVVQNADRPEQKRMTMRIVHDSTNSAPKRKSVSSDLIPRSVLFDNVDEQPSSTSDTLCENPSTHTKLCDRQQLNGIQCSEVTSSDSECDSPSPPPLPERQAMGQRLSFRRDRQSTSSSHLLSGKVGGPRTRNQSNQRRPIVASPNGSPPPLPVKQIRKSVLPVASGYNSDSENNPSNITPGPRPVRTTRLRTPLSSNLSTTRLLNGDMKSSLSILKQKQEAKTPDTKRSPSARVLRSRNTPIHSMRTVSNGSPNLNAAKTVFKPQSTGQKRKTRSFDTHVPALATKVLKLGHSRVSAWPSQILRRSARSPK